MCTTCSALGFFFFIFVKSLQFLYEKVVFLDNFLILVLLQPISVYYSCSYANQADKFIDIKMIIHETQ